MTTVRMMPFGSQATSGAYQCMDCGEMLELDTPSVLPACPNVGDGQHGLNSWRILDQDGTMPADTSSEVFE